MRHGTDNNSDSTTDSTTEYGAERGTPPPVGHPVEQPVGHPTRHHTEPPATVRRATAHDIAELVRLRALLFDARDDEYFSDQYLDDSYPAPVPGCDWRGNLAAAFRDHMASDAVRILVVDAGQGLAACGIGTVERWFPGPHNHRGRVGHVIGVVTDPAHRRRGHSRAIMRSLLGWFEGQEVGRVDLYASPSGRPLYRSLGFTDHPDPALYWRP
ncbi:GNAT family N-acetyltransferase [Streptomyces sp. NPDC052496]|uniref:GNAT family N-acetyltransferase n=1 Tax=Streptomyces sp. NPDC052496 TaxID=3154951 RepID=UPI00342445F0